MSWQALVSIFSYFAGVHLVEKLFKQDKLEHWAYPYIYIYIYIFIYFMTFMYMQSLSYIEYGLGVLINLSHKISKP
jgi:hypothetical protein